ncbi:MAG: DUF255 domain-containing protein [bacterium]|nr:DUF255 domain-containing protein [bacterium]
MNRLAESSSPYLLLHKDNPVDWYPWGAEALDRAPKEDKPIFLSVGYSTCYWCHVMERESFTDEDTAALMNRHFVNIKLDREERPDLDEIYMSATQILTQHGGWPNSVFLTTDLEPFFAGTYFPPIDRPGLPGFRTVLRSMADAWANRRNDVEQQAASVFQAIRHSLEDRPEPGAELPDGSAALRSLTALERSFDPQWGGFGSAPKFPTPSNLLLLLEFADERPRAAEMLTTTLDHMARGGIYDHLGGGFHRYATDREWNIPHFEKMLYDNGWLLEAYGREFARSGDPQAARVIRKTAGFLERELTSPEGALWSALDAETDGHEGAFYVWTREELLDVVGEEDFGFLAPLYGFDRSPFFEGSHYVLHHPDSLTNQARRRRLQLDDLLDQMAPLEAKLLEARSQRKPLLVDDKILSDWNGAAISGLATSGRLLGERSLVAQATGAADFVLETMKTPSGQLLHAWRDGAGEIPAFLADYAYFVRGLLALEKAAGRESGGRWLEAAVRLTEEQIDRLGDPAGGFFAAAEASDVLVRSKDLFDGATPSANAVAILNLLELARATGDSRWRREAERALRSFAPLLERMAEPARMMTIAARRGFGATAGEPQRSRAGASTPSLSPLDAEARERVALSLETAGGGEEAVREFTLTLTIEPGWHIYAPYPGGGDAPDWVRPLEVLGEDVDIGELDFPEAKELPPQPPMPGKDRVRIYEGEVKISGSARTRSQSGGWIRVVFQACDDQRCLAPVQQVLEL